VVNILFSEIQLCWSRSWNEIFAHIKIWRLLLWNEARSLLEWSIVIPGERRLLLHLVLLEVAHVVVVSVLAVEERIIVYLLISKHVLMVNASLFTQVINRCVSAFAYLHVRSWNVVLSFTGILELRSLLSICLQVASLLECWLRVHSWDEVCTWLKWRIS